MDDALHARIEEALDRQEIWRVIQTYGRALDRLDAELARLCYFDDATDDHNNFVDLRDDFIAWARETTREFVNTHHTVLNHYCELDGEEAYTETYYYFWGEREQQPHLGSAGRYIDHFQKRDGAWRIANRVATVEKSFDLFDSTPFPGVRVDRRSVEARPVRRDRGDVSYQRPLKVRAPRPYAEPQPT